ARRVVDHQPDHVVPGVVAPENVRERARASVVVVIEVRPVTILKGRHCSTPQVDVPVSTPGPGATAARGALQATGGIRERRDAGWRPRSIRSTGDCGLGVRYGSPL